MSRKISDTTGLSQLFHLNSEPWANESGDPAPPFAQKTKTDPHAQRVALPATSPGKADQRAATRRSMRAFKDTPLPLARFAAMLRSAYGVVGPDTLDQGQRFLRRPVPSAGGLYPLELYALVRNVSGLATGIYHYDAIADDLEVVATETWVPRAKAIFPTWSFVAQAPAILCIGSVFQRSQSKYGNRGYRYVLLEAGHVGQNICLAAADQGLSTLCMGGYRDGLLNALVGLDGQEEAIVYTVALGVSGRATS